MVVFSVFDSQVFSMLFWSGARRVHGGLIGLHEAFTRLQFCFEGRNQAGFVSVEIFQPLLVGFETFFIFSLIFFFTYIYIFFVSVDFCCCYALVCILQCCSLPSSFVILWDFDVSVHLTDQTLDFTFLCGRIRSFLKNVLTWYFSCSRAHRFVFVLLFIFFLLILLLVAVSSIFGCGRFFLWLDDAGWTRGVLILGGVQCVFVFMCPRGWTDIFPFAGRLDMTRVDKVTRFCIWQ